MAYQLEPSRVPTRHEPVEILDERGSDALAPAPAPAEVDVAVIGAGPVGISVAAHLQARHVDYRLFGKPMEFWERAMPRGLRLKSEGFASSLSDPYGEFTLGKYCAQAGEAYTHVNTPIPASVFVAYGKAFQQKLAPALDPHNVAMVERVERGFVLKLDDGRTVKARRVVVATGLEGYGYLPPELQGVPEDLISHSAEHPGLARYIGKDVVVVGAGASAADTAAGLLRLGARPRILTRRAKLKFPPSLGIRSFKDRWKYPMTSIGPGWKSVLCVKAPLVFHAMPARFRNFVVRKYLGPAPAWFLASELETKVPVIANAQIVGARAVGDGVGLDYRTPDGELGCIQADHVIAATGFQVDLDRLKFLEPGLRALVKRSEGAPLLSRNFASSVPGLYFVGTASSPSFGPPFRFVCGCHFTARRLGTHLARTAKSASVNKGRLHGVNPRREPQDLINA